MFSKYTGSRRLTVIGAVQGEPQAANEVIDSPQGTHFISGESR